MAKYKKRRLFLGSLEGEKIPLKALKKPTLVSEKTQEFLEFCEKLRRGGA